MDAVDGDVAPLPSRFTEPATRDVMEAIRFLSPSPGGEESARRFAAKLNELVGSLRTRVAEEIDRWDDRSMNRTKPRHCATRAQFSGASRDEPG